MKEFANSFNDVFRLLRTNLGTFGQVETNERYDLILTNPPYVTSGTSSLRGAIESHGLGGLLRGGRTRHRVSRHPMDRRAPETGRGRP